MQTPTSIRKTILASGCLLGVVIQIHAQSSYGFTYQGRLNNGTNPATGTYDLRFDLYSQTNGGTTVTGLITNTAVAVSNGLFTTTVDFFNYGVSWTAQDRFLEIAVRTNGGGAFTVLTPRQKLTPTTRAFFADHADVANSANQLNVYLPASQISGTVLDARLSGNVALRAGGNAFTGNQTIASGTLGIGTTAPGQMLQVGDATINGSQGMIRLGSHTTSANDVKRTWDIGVPQTGDDASGQGYSFVINDTVAPTSPQFMIKYGSGNVGIGTAAPDRPLSIKSDSSAAGELLSLMDSGGATRWHVNLGNGKGLNFSQTGVADNRLFLGTNGNVGIGAQNNTGDKLFVAGDFLRIGGNQLQNVILGGDQYGDEVILGSDNGSTPTVRLWNSAIPDYMNLYARDASVRVLTVRGGGSGPALNVAGNIQATGTVTANGVLLTSDRNAKENFTALDGKAVLAKVAALPVTQWNYKTDRDGAQHIGPMAQDFQAAFQLSADDKHISVVDEGGVALAAIQGLNQKVEEKEAEIKELKQRLEKLEQLMAEKNWGAK